MQKIIEGIIVGCIAGLTVGITRTKKHMQIYNEAYVNGMKDFYNEKLNEQNEHIQSLHQAIQERDDLLKKSTNQTERLIEMYQ